MLILEELTCQLLDDVGYNYNTLRYFEILDPITVKPRFTGPLGGKEPGPVNREAR